MPLRDISGAARGALLFGGGAAICWAFLLTAQLESAIPVLLAAAGVGAAIVLLPLRYYRGLRTYVSVGWAIATVVSVLHFHTSYSLQLRPVATVVLLFTLTAWLTRLTVAAYSPPPGDQQRERSAVDATIATSLGVAGTLLALLAVGNTGPLHSSITMPTGWGSTVLTAAMWVAGGGLALAAMTAALTGISLVVDREARPIPLPGKPGKLPRPSPPAPARVSGARDPLSQMARTLMRFVARLVHATTVTLVILADAALLLLYWLGVLAMSWLNWLIGWVLALLISLLNALRILAKAARVATRLVLVPVAGLIVSAWFMASLARSAVRYLTTGASAEIPALLAYGVLGASSLTAVWIALCGLPLARCGRSALRSATVSGAWLLILIAIGGWALGILGFFEVGPIKIGWFTGSATTLLLTIGAIAVVRARARRQPGVANPQA